MALIFPSNPTVGQTYQSGSSGTFVYNGEAWDSQNSNLPVTVTSASFASYAVSSSFLDTPYIYLWGNPNQGINNSSTIYSTNTRIPLNGLTNAYQRGSFTVSSTGVTPSISGWYEIQCIVSGLDAGGANTLFSLGAGVNGTAITGTTLTTVVSSGYGMLTVNAIAYVTAGQLIDFRCGTTGGELITVNNTSVIITYRGA